MSQYTLAVSQGVGERLAKFGELRTLLQVFGV